MRKLEAGLRYIILLIVMALIMYGSFDSDISKITPWLLGINFTLALFSINFTFFGYQLSKYKLIYDVISNRQWFNIILLMVLPFIPLVCFLLAPDYFDKAALWMLPLLIFSAIDNARMTTKYLSPKRFLDRIANSDNISKYLLALSKEVNIEVEKYQIKSKRLQNFQRSVHGSKFEPTLLGVQPYDLWDSITVVTKLSIKNNDYPIFRQSITAIFKVIVASYSYKYEGDDNHLVNSGIKDITRKRFHSIFSHIVGDDVGGMFLQSLSNELCGFLREENVIFDPCSSMTRAIADDVVWMGQKMLEYKGIIQPINNLNALQEVIETNLHKWDSNKEETTERSLDEYNVSAYAYDIEALGVAAIKINNPHFAYRCMESLSYLGCNAAKIKSQQTIVAVFEALVQLGRTARAAKIDCFSQRCLIPMESHVEELMGHILTWLVHDIDSGGNFFIKEYAEQAYSRLRGVKCKIKVKANLNPCFWIEELQNDDKKIPHVEQESGMFGYGGQCDYSDFTNLKGYALTGIAPESGGMIFHSSPIPLKIIDEEE